MVSSYLVIVESGRAAPLAESISVLGGCEVALARNRDVLLVVSESPSAAHEAQLRERIADLPGVRSLVLAFAELDPESQPAEVPSGRRTLPVVEPRPTP